MKFGQRVVSYFVEDIRLTTYFAGFPIIVVAFGIAYWLLSFLNHGLRPDRDGSGTISVFDGLYFSVVTVASLGYGDLRPIGASRILASVEVLFGLSFLGIVIAKITSQRLAHHVRRLFSSDAQKRLNDFTRFSERTNRRLSRSMQLLGKAYQPTPDQAGDRRKAREEAQSSFKTAITGFRQGARDLNDYFESEAQQGGYFDIVPSPSIGRLGETIDEGMMILTQLVISLSPEAKTEILDGSIRQGISDILAAHKRTCEIFAQYCRHATLTECFARIGQTCDLFPEKIFSAPGLPTAAEQPDQIPERVDQP